MSPVEIEEKNEKKMLVFGLKGPLEPMEIEDKFEIEKMYGMMKCVGLKSPLEPVEMEKNEKKMLVLGPQGPFEPMEMEKK